MPRSWQRRLDDMLEAVANIERVDLATLHREPLMQLALERSFEILLEASRHVPPEVKRDHAHIRWQDLADFGNLLRHRYHKVSRERLIETAESDVPPLKRALIAMKAVR